MIPREHLGTALVPGGAELRLYSHDGHFVISLARTDLMSTRMRHSEEMLAVLTLERLEAPAPHLLIGGYGMGFTLRAALAALPPQGRATVVELVPEILEWARGPMAAVAAGCLDDPRVAVVLDDVGDHIAAARPVYDAILLDVDNGPESLVHEANGWLYTPNGLAAARRALRPQGVLAVWSAFADKGFSRRLERAGFGVETQTVHARPNGKGARHTIWFARRA